MVQKMPMALSKANIKYLQALQQKKFRQKYNKFIVEGDKLAREIMEQRPGLVEAFYALPDWLEAWCDAHPEWRDRAQAVSENELKRISGLSTPNQVLVLARRFPLDRWSEAPERGLFLFLEDLQDPGNLGAVLRIADWFGLSGVVCSPDCVECFNPKVVQASMGAVWRVPLYSATFQETSARLAALPIFATVPDGPNIFQVELPPAALIVIGNESKGISSELLRSIPSQLTIPSYASSGTESLNAAVAAGIVVALFRRAL